MIIKDRTLLSVDTPGNPTVLLEVIHDVLYVKIE